MLSWINLIVLLISTALMAFFYIRSVGPAKLEQKIGEIAYKKCGNYRIIASVFEVIVVINYIIYFFLPLPISIPQFFIWEYWISVTLSIVILIPSLYIMLKGVKDAGREALFPDKEHTLYRGIYEKIRHPQALGEVFLWWGVALLLNSPFLFVYSIVWFPLFYWFCKAEEKDLIIRYGKPYIDYKNRVGMFFPKKRKLNEK
ncbi:MAG: isoprenylcysteine carboxylmethyltransferase family protein [Promethearchaeota archaeon]|nr:MAG: isoprenylcysteine carboxylmethyltransferase family protein [Candidatus Lokiarchaeota archaeon]